MKKKTLLFLRFILILATVLVMTYSKKGLTFPQPGYTIALIYLVSNFFLYFLSEKFFSKSFVSFFIFLFDIITISLAIYYTQGLETDFYLIYFLVIFIASVGQDIGGSIPTAVIASIFYGWLIYRSNPDISLFDSAILLRIPFLFIIALISSYWSQSTRRELKKKEELDWFNRELKKEVARVAAEEIELRQYTEKIIDSVSSGVIAVRNDGIVTTLNPEAERVFGFEKEEIVGYNIKNIRGLESLWQKMAQSINSGVSLKRDEVSIKNRDNKIIPVGFSISPITGSNDRFSGCVVIFKDLSEIKALSKKLKQAEKLSYLGKMASWVAHEIRNPLAVIDGFARLLSTTEKKNKRNLYCSEIYKATRRIDHIIEDILAFAKTKKKEPKLTEINLKSLVEYVVKDINIKSTIKDDTAAIVEGEMESIRRVFVNLITNSVEAMKKNGRLKINFSTNKKWVITEIIDNGVGISTEDMKNLFTPFFTTKQRGTGLGLSIVKKIVEEHKGKIEMESEEGKGTTVRVYLPKNKA